MLFQQILFLCFIICVSTQNVKVTIKQGTAIGHKADDGNYFAFYGIPYGGDVTGKNRFKAAPDPPDFNGEFDAVKNVVCAQPTSTGLVGEENCLTLNLFTNNVTGTKPVYVYLNGEDYSRTNDTPRYSYRSLVEADIIFIALNYRLSIFGFLCLGVEEAPGNAGLKDVIKALQWVSTNVAAFGGDPNNVILFGHGSGAAMVDLITMSPQSENLVHRAVVISGSALAPWAVAYDPASYAKTFAAKLAYTDEDYKILGQHLENTKPEVLVTAINEFEFTNSSLLFAPCVENTQLSGYLLEKAPINILKDGTFRSIPYMAIYVSEEGTLRAKEAVHGNWLERMHEHFVDFLPVGLKFDNHTAKNHVAQYIRRYYFGAKDIAKENIEDYLEYWGDTLITLPIIRGVKERATVVEKNSLNIPIFLLRFHYKNISDPFWPYREIPVTGTRHSAMLQYIFDLDTVQVDNAPKSSMVNRFVAFAKTGSPVAPLDTPGDVDWPEATGTNMRYLSIVGQHGLANYEEKPLTNPHSQAFQFWAETVSEYYSAPESIFVTENGTDGSDTTKTILLVVLICVLVLLTLTSGLLFYLNKTKKLQKYIRARTTSRNTER